MERKAAGRKREQIDSETAEKKLLQLAIVHFGLQQVLNSGVCVNEVKWKYKLKVASHLDIVPYRCILIVSLKQNGYWRYLSICSMHFSVAIRLNHRATRQQLQYRVKTQEDNLNAFQNYLKLFDTVSQTCFFILLQYLNKHLTLIDISNQFSVLLFMKIQFRRIGYFRFK